MRITPQDSTAEMKDERDLITPFESLQGALRSFTKHLDFVPKSFSNTAILCAPPDGTAKLELRVLLSHSSPFPQMDSGQLHLD